MLLYYYPTLHTTRTLTPNDESANDDERDLLRPEKITDEKENNAPILDVVPSGLELTASNVRNGVFVLPQFAAKTNIRRIVTSLFARLM